MREGFLVGAGRADEDKLPGAPAKQIDPLFQLLRLERNIVHHHIPAFPAKRRSGGRRIGNVGDDLTGAGTSRLPATVEESKFKTPLHGQLRASRTDGARATDKEDFHILIFLDPAKPLKRLEKPLKDGRGGEIRI